MEVEAEAFSAVEALAWLQGPQVVDSSEAEWAEALAVEPRLKEEASSEAEAHLEAVSWDPLSEVEEEVGSSEEETECPQGSEGWVEPRKEEASSEAESVQA